MATTPCHTVTLRLVDGYSKIQFVATAVNVGGSSDIFKGYVRQCYCSCTCVAIKRASGEQPEPEELMEREAKIWDEVHRHRHILSFIGRARDDKGNIYLVSPFMAKGDLFTYVRSSIESKTLREIASALAFLHSQAINIVHGDVKAQNILISTKDRAHLFDFGSAIQTSYNPQ
ncbi:hypothetical protein FRB99_006816, partial [Tulasnella sp. 403]